ncbi:MAG: hypothetical protein HY898_24820 [Deltaproteobacteria bacterium]|nr:hypothetical protein [Deltaproteobacteria bacterium]
MTPLSSDTNPVAEQVWIGLLRNATPARRFHLASSLSSSVIRWSRRAIQETHPTSSDDELSEEFVRLNYGPDLALAVRERLAARRRSGAP